MNSENQNDIHYKRFILFVFRFVGICLLMASIVWGVLIWRFTMSAAMADGVVIKLNQGGSHPEIQFTTADNKVVDYPQGGMISGYKVGDKVRVLYDKENTARAEIDSFGALWGFQLAGMVISLIFIFISFTKNTHQLLNKM
jgi:hypothetical protein